MNPRINILTIFEHRNQAALDQLSRDFLIDSGAIFFSADGTVVASGVTVLDLQKGSMNGGTRIAAASSAAQGDGKDKRTLSVAVTFSENDAQTKLTTGSGQQVTVFNGALPEGERMGGKEGYTVLIRDPKAPVVTDEEFVRLAESGHVAGVEAFTTARDNKGRVDVPRSLVVSYECLVCHEV